MTETVICARCHGSFERVRAAVDDSSPQFATVTISEERELVCEECEHEFLAWTCCPPIV